VVDTLIQGQGEVDEEVFEVEELDGVSYPS
jgi:hypothetical protein